MEPVYYVRRDFQDIIWKTVINLNDGICFMVLDAGMGKHIEGITSNFKASWLIPTMCNLPPHCDGSSSTSTQDGKKGFLIYFFGVPDNELAVNAERSISGHMQLKVCYHDLNASILRNTHRIWQETLDQKVIFSLILLIRLLLQYEDPMSELTHKFRDLLGENRM
ncbi:hypothetical protein TNCT_652211 [Trichonephila clavata]|uniref:Uncharacterized protein n=1 Tax=Trichonephila clavata TaxID=2740835 RepID=A0A8X6HUI5_TRICU|nr:hypothetical protein TNCT_652211 [Trichonephila clavata]